MRRDEPIIEEEPIVPPGQNIPSEFNKREPSPTKEKLKKQEVDLFHDPLLPDDEEMFESSQKKKRKRAGSFSDKHKEKDEDMDDEEGIAYDELNSDEKLVVLQQMYEEYNRNPDAFPDDQRALLEEELKIMIEKGYIQNPDDDESEDDERMQAKGEIKFPSEPLPFSTDEEEVEKEVLDKEEDKIEVHEVDMKRSSQDGEEQKGKVYPTLMNICQWLNS
jgi:hypothetical protein